MLTSAKRKVLNVICVTMAIASVTYGLVLKSNKSNLDVVASTEKTEIDLSAVETPTIVEANYIKAEPNN